MKSQEHIELELKRLEGLKRENEYNFIGGKISRGTYDRIRAEFDFKTKIKMLKWVLNKEEEL